MRKSGVVRRAVILIAFAWAFSHFVLNGSQFNWSPKVREWLQWVLYGSVAFGVVTLFADRFSDTAASTEAKNHDHNATRPGPVGSEETELSALLGDLSNPLCQRCHCRCSACKPGCCLFDAPFLAGTGTDRHRSSV